MKNQKIARCTESLSGGNNGKVCKSNDAVVEMERSGGIEKYYNYDKVDDGM